MTEGDSDKPRTGSLYIGAQFSKRVPDGDDRQRLVCDDCGHVHYENPKLVVGAVCRWGDRILLAKRNIPPRRGYWTIPAGYMELGEAASAGAAREVREEARAEVTITGLLAVYELPHISQVHMIYRAEMLSADHEPGAESQETALIAYEEIPWDDLAYPSVHWALMHDQQIHDAAGLDHGFQRAGRFPPFGNGPVIDAFKTL